MPKMFGYQAKEIAYNMYLYYKKRKMNKNTSEYRDDINIIDTISDVTKMPKSSITRFIKEGNAMLVENGVVDFKPKEKKKHTRKKRVIVDGFTEGIIRRKGIHLPSARKLHAVLREENILLCSKEYLRQLLARLGFTSTEGDTSGIFKERSDVLSGRMCYLTAIKTFRSRNRPIFYLNEAKRLVHENDATSKEMPSFLMVHMTGPHGFLDKSQLMLKIKESEDEDYDHFANYDWVKDIMLPNVPSNSVIVVNIPQSETPEINEEKPTADSPRPLLEDWLNKHDIPFQKTISKSKLMELINSQEMKQEYNIIKLIKDNGHDILHLPPYHDDLNPVAVMWHDVKNETETTPIELFTNYSKERWESCLTHVKENEEEYYKFGLKIIKPVVVLNSEKSNCRDASSSTSNSSNDDSMDSQ